MVQEPATKLMPNNRWQGVVGVLFAAFTLGTLTFFAYEAGTREPLFVCRSFPLISVVFALGAALSAGYIGGSAHFGGSIDGRSFLLAGGAAVLILSLYAVTGLKPECSGPSAEVVGKQIANIDKTIATIYNRSIRIEESTGDDKLKGAANEIQSQSETLINYLNEISDQFGLDPIPLQYGARPRP